MVFPVSAPCAKNFFSKLNIVKIRLRNRLSELNLKSLLMIATESPKQGFGKNTLDMLLTI